MSYCRVILIVVFPSSIDQFWLTCRPFRLVRNSVPALLFFHPVVFAPEIRRALERIDVPEI